MEDSPILHRILIEHWADPRKEEYFSFEEENCEAEELERMRVKRETTYQMYAPSGTPFVYLFTTLPEHSMGAQAVFTIMGCNDIVNV